MKKIFNRIACATYIFLGVFATVGQADEAATKEKIDIKNNYLEIFYVGNTESERLESHSDVSDSDFLFSREIAKNQIIGMNYREQEFNNSLAKEEESRLWVSLKLVF